MQQPQQVYNVVEVAKMLNVSRRTVYRWIQQGKMPAHHVMGKWRIFLHELRAKCPPLAGAAEYPDNVVDIYERTR